jgi:tRNA modification GTPase
LRAGTDELNQAIWNEVMGGSTVLQDISIAISARHQACIREARTMLTAAMRSLEQGTSPEFISIDLRGALDAIGEVAGKIDTEELLGKIFSEFCIGK